MLSVLRRVEEAAHRLARLFIGIGRGVRQEMQAAMDVGVFLGIGVLDRVEHRLRLLRRGAVVEIDQRLAVDFARQDREVAADRLDVVGRGIWSIKSCPVAYHPSQRRAVLRKPCCRTSHRLPAPRRSASSSSSSITSATNALTSRPRARLLVDAARHQVEQMVVVDLGDGRAMAALHVVGEDFQLRLGRELAIVRQQQRVAGHLGVGLLRVLVDVDAALEDAARLAGHDVADHFRRAGVRHGVVEHHGHVGMRVAGQQIDAAQREVGALARRPRRGSPGAPACRRHS